MVALLGIEIVLVASFLVSGLLLREQAANQRATISRMSQQLRDEGVISPEVDIARQMLAVRQERIDWSPKLAALSERIDPSLILVRVSAFEEGREEGRLMEIEGTTRDETGLADVSRFVGALREDPRIVGDLPDVQLGNIRGAEGGRFLVVCRQEGSR